MRSGRLLRPAMESEIQKEALERPRSACLIEAAGLGEGVGDYAAVAAALYSLDQKTSCSSSLSPSGPRNMM